MSAVERQELASAKKIPSLEVVEQKVYKWPWQNLLQIHTKKINLIRLEKIKLVLVWTKLRNILEMFMFWWRILEFRDCIKIYIKNVGVNIWIPPAHTDKGDIQKSLLIFSRLNVFGTQLYFIARENGRGTWVSVRQYWTASTSVLYKTHHYLP